MISDEMIRAILLGELAIMVLIGTMIYELRLIRSVLTRLVELELQGRS